MQSLHRIAAAVLLSLGTAIPGSAQAATTGDPLSPVCPAGKLPVIDSLPSLVGLAPAAEFHGRAYDEAQRMRMMYYADAIRRHFVVPSSLGVLPLLADRQPTSDSIAFQYKGMGILGADLILIVGRNGRLRKLAWQLKGLSEPLTSALIQAAREADAAGDFDGIPSPGEGPRQDTLAINVLSSPRDTAIAVPLMRVRIPSYLADAWPAVVKMPPVQYPRTALAAGVTAKVDVVFVIGSTARVIPESIQFARADWVDFIEPIRRALLVTEFRAGTSGGCAVPTKVQQPFEFSINRP